MLYFWALIVIGGFIVATRLGTLRMFLKCVYILTDTTLVRRLVGWPDVEIRLSAIGALYEHSKKLIVESSYYSRTIAIPQELESFDGFGPCLRDIVLLRSAGTSLARDCTCGYQCDRIGFFADSQQHYVRMLFSSLCGLSICVIYGRNNLPCLWKVMRELQGGSDERECQVKDGKRNLGTGRCEKLGTPVQAAQQRASNWSEWRLTGSSAV